MLTMILKNTNNRCLYEEQSVMIIKKNLYSKTFKTVNFTRHEQLHCEINVLMINQVNEYFTHRKYRVLIVGV